MLWMCVLFFDQNMCIRLITHKIGCITLQSVKGLGALEMCSSCLFIYFADWCVWLQTASALVLCCGRCRQHLLPLRFLLPTHASSSCLRSSFHLCIWYVFFFFFLIIHYYIHSFLFNLWGFLFCFLFLFSLVYLVGFFFFLVFFLLFFPKGRPGMSDVSPLSGISGLSFDSTLLSPVLFFCLVLLPFLSYCFLPAGPFFSTFSRKFFNKFR